MQNTKLLLGVIIVLTIMFLGFQIFGLQDIGNLIRPFLLPLLTVLYCMTNKCKKSYFFYFLLLYAISEFLGIFSPLAENSFLIDNILFYGGNLLYITAYCCLSIGILKAMNLRKIFNRFPFHIVILLALDIYSIVLVTDTAYQSDFLYGIIDYLLELLYNTSVMLLLTVTLINYISRDSKKAMNLLLGAICIVFSEVIQVAYFYVSDINILSIVYSILLVFAFCFFYIQSSMSYMKAKKYEVLEKLKV
tara:strand:+ start:2861 stop:3604 length:744 start_codon:yes stop_codon:yes gene_type:complete